MDPFASPMVESKSTATHFVPVGGMQKPVTRDWDFDNAVNHGYKASSWVYACADIIARHCSRFRWVVQEINDEGDWETRSDDDRSSLLSHPNDHWQGGQLVYFAALHLMLGGNALWRLVMLRGEPVEVWPMSLEGVEPIPHARRWLSHYEVTPKGSSRVERVDPKLIIHAQLPDPSNPYWGQSRLKAAGRVVDMDVTQVTWNRELVENDGVPSFVLVDPMIKTDAEMDLATEAVRKMFGGPANARTPAVLPGGAKVEHLGIPPRELDWIESRKFSAGEICAALGLLPSRFITEAQTFANLQAAIRYEVEHGALPLAGLIGDAFSKSLIPIEERRQGVRIAVDLAAVTELREDMHQAAESYERLVGALVPPQKAAALLDMPLGEIPGGEDSYRRTSLERVDTEDDTL